MSRFILFVFFSLIVSFIFSVLVLKQSPQDMLLVIKKFIRKTRSGTTIENGGFNMNLKKIAVFVVTIALLTVFAIGGIGVKRIGAGHVGIKVHLAGHQRGVDDYPTVVGWIFYIPFFTQVVEYPTFMQTATWTSDPKTGRMGKDDSISFNTKDQLLVSADINLSYIIMEQKVPHFYVQFRSDNLDNFTHGYLHNVAKDAFNGIGSKYTFDEINGEMKEKVLQAVKDRINEDLNKYGVMIQQFGLLGALRPPEQVMKAITAKMEAIQRAQQAENEVREARAQAAKAVAKAEGEAKANHILAQSISPQLIQWRQLEITQQAVAKWNGARPMVEGSGSNLLLQLPFKERLE
jgi:regulator of protease activity HflC (stomatin/prohibitin superfamily)